ncbi:MipA/OmpV family protein [Microbulbifer litoralis]|uniref:MipA/OmpV family protein n=1 Tax=Microbulbifer litoralis TaxID=2933965 RepID=UPI002028C549|nr:MipA/OmpV family protein [Microbulbifer sp. GX H0434]
MTLTPLTSRRFTCSAALLALCSFEARAEAENQEATPEESPWRVFLGAGVLSMPEFEGSDDQQTRVLPIINVRYKRFFLGGAPGIQGGLGFYLFENDNWDLGAVVSPDVIGPREESDDARLRGLGDIEATTRAGVFGSYTADWLSLNASVLTDVGDNGQGTQVNLGATATYKVTPRFHLTASPEITWANDEYMQIFFGVNEQQAINSGYAPYEVDAGTSQMRLSLGTRYILTPRWGLGASITTTYLPDDAEDSPAVFEQNQYSYGLFVTYRF